MGRTRRRAAAAADVPGVPDVPVIPGSPSWLTGEFYAAIAPAVAALVGAVTGHAVVPGAVEHQLISWGSLAVIAYVLARSALKAAHVHASATIARAQAIASARAGGPAASVNLDAVAAVAARHAVDPKVLAAEIADAVAARMRADAATRKRARS